MYHHIRAIALAAILAVAAPFTASAETLRLDFAQSVNVGNASAQLSSIRGQNGLQGLAHSARLQAAAQAHADDMARSGQFSHRGANGSTLRTRVRAAGYNACFMAENIAFGQNSISRVMTDWMNSAGHRRNMLDRRVTQYGLARTGTYWVLVLGRNC
ncbi:CAP domain-containing protein [Gymnodinialimonas sp. 2305UL16-5]|uniref:CAP domain-containing protein n=1 Tax=Gymnodinialimonas mytili TaxID=3126503 RepID=UPI0030AACF48